MPTYAYRCTECEHEFDVFARISDRPRPRKCPACGGRAERQITGGAGFLFKGEGFYVTDYRSEEYRSKAKAETEEPAEKKADEKKEKAAKRPAKKAPESGAAKGGEGAAD